MISGETLKKCLKTMEPDKEYYVHMGHSPVVFIETCFEAQSRHLVDARSDGHGTYIKLNDKGKEFIND